MRVPHEDKVIHQTFNSKKLEFVWRFDNKQIILSVDKERFFRAEAGTVNENEDYLTGSPEYVISGRFDSSIPSIILNASIWTDGEEYNFFTNGKDLVPLIEDVIEYLK